jgi:uncharacterized protein (DUF697 family)
MTEQDARAEQILQRYSMLTAGAGLIPIPLVDAAAIAALQYRMVSDIAAAYDVSFDGERVRTLIGSLLGGASSTALGYSLGQSYIKGIPVVGPLLSLMTMPGAAAAVTWAVGRVFMQHFALGGTLLDFEPEKMRASVKAHAASRAKA